MAKMLQYSSLQYIKILIIYLQSQLRVLFDVIISLVSQHVSAPLGHLQVNHNILWLLKIVKIVYCDSPEDGPNGPKHVVK
jgi:hypothetical protein